MGTADFIGGRGESIAKNRLTWTHPNKVEAFFWPHFLGGKSETFDFLVVLKEAGGRGSFFFVQVKTTRREFTRTQKPKRLTVRLAEIDVRRMAAFPAPTYLVGVQEPSERAFIIGIDGTMSNAVSSITTAHELIDETLILLWSEVHGFWRSFDQDKKTSTFRND